METKNVTDVLKTETTRQTVILLFSIAGAIATVAIARRFSDPDIGRYYRMYLALWVKRHADKRVTFWQNIADHAATTYNAEKM